MKRKILNINEIEKFQLIEEIMNKFSDEKRIFQNEAQFQYELALELNNYLTKEIKVILELASITKTIKKNNKTYYKRDESDIIIKDEKGNFIVIELKYKTENSEYQRKGYGIINLAGQGAEDLYRYDYLLDIKRIESLSSKNSKNQLINKELKHFVVGYAILLTNAKNYWLISKKAAEKTRYKNYCISDKDKIIKNKNLDWNNPKKSKLGKPFIQRPSLMFKYNYCFKWNDYYSENSIKELPFRYLITKIR